jgi:N-formylglutamate deformylase
MGSFEVLRPPGPPAPVVVHVPHASTVIPADVRGGITLDDPALATELLRLTDHRTDVLAEGTASAGAIRFVNRCSRLVVDPERFPDEREALAVRGMAAVYTHGHDRQPIREADPGRDQDLLDRFLVPYAEELADLVGEVVERHGVCTIVDLHSYPAVRLPYELHDGPRPPVCVGTDPHHTPGWLVDLVADAAHGYDLETVVNSPFTGTYVPLDRYGTDAAVTSVMLEIRRDTYLDEETAQPHDGETAVASFVTAVVTAIAAHHARTTR